MKSIPMVFLFVSLLLSAQAQSELTIFTNADDPFILYVNGGRINATAATQVKAEGIKGDGCKVRAVFSSSQAELDKYVMLEPNQSLVFEIKKGSNGKYALRMVSSGVAAPQVSSVTSTTAPAQGTSSEAQVVTAGIAGVASASENSGNATSSEETVSATLSIGGINTGIGITIKEEKTVSQSTQSSVVQQTGSPYTPYRNFPGFCPTVSLSATELLKFKAELESQYLDVDKSSKILSLMKSKCASSKQLSEMMLYIKASHFRYNTAMNAFPGLFDPGYFDLVSALVEDQAMREKLDAYALSYLASASAEPSAASAVVSTQSESRYQPGTQAGCSMTETQYQDALKSIKSKPFSETRMAVVKEATRNRCLTIDQIKGLAGVFDHEEDKLEFLKIGYDLAIQKEEYYKCGDVLSFDSSVEELMDFIESKK